MYRIFPGKVLPVSKNIFFTLRHCPCGYKLTSMKHPLLLLGTIIILILTGCSSSRKTATVAPVTNAGDIKSKVVIKKKVPVKVINTRNVKADELVNFAEK